MSTEERPKRRHRFPRPWWIACSSGSSWSLAVLLALALSRSLSSETARTKIIEVLAARLDSEVQLDSLTLQGASATAGRRRRSDDPAQGASRRAAAHLHPQLLRSKATSSALLRRHVSTVTLEGLEIQIPPRDHDDADDSDDDKDSSLKLKPAYHHRQSRHEGRAAHHHPAQAGQATEGVGHPRSPHAVRRLRQVDAVRSDADQRRAARRDRDERHVRSVARRANRERRRSTARSPSTMRI